jgi:mersacidin/lichenicidin family type 2 lantibiotic
MSQVDVIRAWKDAEYRRSLTEEQRALLPEHPAGLIELTHEQLTGIHGGGDKHTVSCPTGYCPTFPHYTCTC